MQKRLQSVRKERMNFSKCPEEYVALYVVALKMRHPYRGLRGQIQFHILHVWWRLADSAKTARCLLDWNDEHSTPRAPTEFSSCVQHSQNGVTSHQLLWQPIASRSGQRCLFKDQYDENFLISQQEACFTCCEFWVAVRPVLEWMLKYLDLLAGEREKGVCRWQVVQIEKCHLCRSSHKRHGSNAGGNLQQCHLRTISTWISLFADE